MLRLAAVPPTDLNMPDKNETGQRLARIADRRCSEAGLVRAISHLGAIAEDPGFWLKIADDTSYRISHRRHVIFQLFYRHVHPGMTLAQLAALVRGRPWLPPESVSVVGDLGGSIPVRLTFDNTVFVIEVLPGSSGEDRWLVYVSVAGQIELDDCRRILRGETAALAAGDAVIVELGFVPPVIDSVGHAR